MTRAASYNPRAWGSAINEANEARATVAALHRRCVPDGYRCVMLGVFADELSTLWTPDNPALPMVTVTQDSHGMRSTSGAFATVAT